MQAKEAPRRTSSCRRSTMRPHPAPTRLQPRLWPMPLQPSHPLRQPLHRVPPCPPRMQAILHPRHILLTIARKCSRPLHRPTTPQVPRQMAAFKDTRFRSMGCAPVAAEPAQPFVSPFEATATAALVSAAEALAPSPSPALHSPVSASEAPAPVLAAEDLVAMEAPASLTAAIVASYPSLPAEPISAEPPVLVPPPVPAPPAPSLAQAQVPSLSTDRRFHR